MVTYKLMTSIGIVKYQKVKDFTLVTHWIKFNPHKVTYVREQLKNLVQMKWSFGGLL